MYKTTLTIGLNDKDTEYQIISTDDAKNQLAAILIGDYGFYAYTLTECAGVYRMNSTGNIIHENSLKVEIATDDIINNLDDVVNTLKVRFNQETIMVEQEVKLIEFK